MKHVQQFVAGLKVVAVLGLLLAACWLVAKLLMSGYEMLTVEGKNVLMGALLVGFVVALIYYIGGFFTEGSGSRRR